jgi:hypothetical protein
MGDSDPEHLAETLRQMVPKEHLEFARKLLADHGVPELPEGESNEMRLLGWTEATAMPQIEAALRHPKVRLIANALGTPPADAIEKIHAAGLKVAALCGSPHQAKKHVEAGVDIVIGQGTEGGGHTGEVGSIVLWPQIIKAAAPTPVLAAGGIGSGEQIAAAMAMGAQGVWTGSLWRRPTLRRRRSSSCSTPPRGTPCAAGRSRASPPGCCATGGRRRGRARRTRTRCPCPSSTWSRGTAWPAAGATPTRRAT